MKSPLQRIEELIPVLPGKDATICMNYLKQRNLQYILEIVESDLYKANKKHSSDAEVNPDDYMSSLTELRGELLTYMSYLEVPDNSDEYDDY
jgi:hypothetical protein